MSMCLYAHVPVCTCAYMHLGIRSGGLVILLLIFVLFEHPIPRRLATSTLATTTLATTTLTSFLLPRLWSVRLL